MAKKKKRAFLVDLEGAVNEKVTGKYMGGRVELSGYKGSVYLEVVKPGHCPHCQHGEERISIAMNGIESFDKLIAALRRARAVWKKKTDDGRGV